MRERENDGFEVLSFSTEIVQGARKTRRTIQEIKSENQTVRKKEHHRWFFFSERNEMLGQHIVFQCVNSNVMTLRGTFIDDFHHL